MIDGQLSVIKQSSGEQRSMLTTSGPRSGGEILIDTLKIHGIDTVFCLPGKAFWPQSMRWPVTATRSGPL